jgi:hypothetical protein
MSVRPSLAVAARMEMVGVAMWDMGAVSREFVEFCVFCLSGVSDDLPSDQMTKACRSDKIA